MRVLAVCSLLVLFIGLGYSFRISDFLEPFNEQRQDDSDVNDQILPVFAAAFIATAINGIIGSIPPPAEPEWKYCYKDEKCGEEAWKENVATCNGFRQSPIDVTFMGGTPVDDTMADNGKLTFTGYDTVRTFAIENTAEHYERFSETGLGRADDKNLKNKGGKTVQLDVLSTSTALLKGGPLSDEYKVLQLHFHWGSDDTKGSEHTYDGMAFPMELHVVHWNSKYLKGGSADLDTILTSVDGLAVTGFMFQLDPADADNAALKPITDALMSINEADSFAKLTTFKLDQLIAPAITPGMTYATYPGGLTTPPCNEVVTWINFKDPLTISKAQLKAFRELMDGKGGMIVNNFRSPQPAAGRVPKLFKTSMRKRRNKNKNKN